VTFPGQLVVLLTVQPRRLLAFIAARAQKLRYLKISPVRITYLTDR